MSGWWQYKHMAQEARALQKDDLAMELLGEFKKWTRLPRKQREKRYRQYGDRTVGPRGHTYNRQYEKHHRHGRQHETHAFDKATRKVRAMARRKQERAKFKANQRYRVRPHRFPHEDGADLGDNYIAGLFNKPLKKQTYSDNFIKNNPTTLRDHTPGDI
jgi:hypothetical protein